MNISEIYDANLRKALEKGLSILRELECVDGVFLFGSIARKQYDSYSDVDLMVMIRQASCLDFLRKRIGTEFSDSVKMEKDGKIILFPPGLPKIEFYILNNGGDEEAKKLFAGSRIAKAEDSILFDRTGNVTKMLDEWNRAGEDEISSRAASEADSFLYYYDIMNSYLFRGDSYRAFFYYNLSFFKLATLVAMSNGITDYTYAPQWLTQLVGSEEAKSLKGISTGMFPAQMVSKKDRMLDLFMEVINSSHELFTGVQEKAMKMSDYLRERYSGFWRLKDMHIAGYIGEGLLYRSARLDTQPAVNLQNWIRSAGLKTIVDLRNDSELSRHGYSREIVDSIRYVNAPIFQDREEADHEEMQSVEEEVDTQYLSTIKLKSFRDAARTVFNLLSDANNLPLLIHCNAGVDRTGMIMAVILSALGVNREIIRYNYGVASGLRKSNYIDKFLDSIDAMGGVEMFLDQAGIETSTLEKTRYNLLNSDHSNGDTS